jgi:hypothetical protein
MFPKLPGILSSERPAGTNHPTQQNNPDSQVITLAYRNPH